LAIYGRQKLAAKRNLDRGKQESFISLPSRHIGSNINNIGVIMGTIENEIISLQKKIIAFHCFH
jgi:hypothetical protein